MHTSPDTRTSGFALIAGTLGGIFTMAIHPHASVGITLAQAQHLALASAIAHSIAIVSFIAVFLGACGLTRVLAALTPSCLPFAALVVFATACTAILIAAAVDGFIVPRLFVHMLNDDPTYKPQWHIAIDAIFQFNQAFAQIYSVAASASLVLWSVATLRAPAPQPLSRALALYGCIAPPLLVLLLLAGHLRLNIHGMLAVILVQALWFVAAGAQLRANHNRHRARPNT